jgi:hypothetical protein
MNDLSMLWLLILLRTTAFLALAYVVTSLVFALTRLDSPRIQYIGWLAVLSVGWLFIQVPVTLRMHTVST